MRKPSLWLVVFVSAVAVGAAFASRNSSGTYSLPSGNPVVTGTTITSSWANNTLADIGTELTNSLDRSGRGAMLSALQLANGSSTAPGLTFSSEQSTGLYRAASNDLKMQIAASTVQRWQPTATTFSTGIVANANATNGNGAVITGAGSGDGIQATGGAGDGRGLLGTAGGNGYGVEGDGSTGSGDGVHGLGGSLGVGGIGGSFQGGGTAGTGVTGLGSGTGLGGKFTAGTSSTGASPTDALSVTNGNIKLDGVANPNSTVAVKNRVTPKNIVKAWGVVNGAGTLGDGFNVASVSLSSSTLTVTLAQAMASTNYSVEVTCLQNSTTNLALAQAFISSTTVFTIQAFNLTTTPTLTATWEPCSFVVLGQQ